MIQMLTVFKATETEPRIGAPAGWKVVNGEPIAKAWRCYTSKDGKRFSGLWACTRGTFEVAYDKWEFCHLLSGSCRITPDDGDPVIVRAGDAFVLDKTFKGTWEIIEDCSKHFVFIAD
jgi:uncharacterized protein